MVEIMNQITDKPGWEKKIFDDEIVFKWKHETLGTRETHLKAESFDWCIAELRHESKDFIETKIQRAIDGGIYKSDSLIPEDLKKRLKDAAAKLEDVPEYQKDWHPNTDNLVLDLVHPSLFPLIYGTSRILGNGSTSLTDFLKGSSDTSVVPKPTKEEVGPPIQEFSGYQEEEYYTVPNNAFSADYQWLPADIRWDKDGAVRLVLLTTRIDQLLILTLRIVSYINNLHPIEHKDLYEILEGILALVIPQFDKTFMVLRYPRSQQNRVKCYGIEYPKGYAEHEFRRKEEGETWDDWSQEQEEWISARPVNMPQVVDKFYPPEKQHINDDYAPGKDNDQGGVEILPFSLRKEFPEGAQVIFKLANIHLSPEKPKYNGGSWHVEGQLVSQVEYCIIEA
jgi:hypothetical protein